jgi:hypothetical protein
VSPSPCHFCMVGILIQAVVNLLRGPHFPWVRIFLTTFFLRHATPVQQDIFLQAAANYLPDPQFPRVSSIGSPRCTAASARPLCCFFRPSAGFTMASSLGTFRWSPRTASFLDLAQSSLYLHPSFLGRPLSRFGMPSGSELQPLR